MVTYYSDLGHFSHLVSLFEQGLGLEDAHIYLYMQDKQFDSAVKVMMDRSPAYSHDLFLDAIVKVRNAEMMYKAVQFYLTMHPMEAVVGSLIGGSGFGSSPVEKEFGSVVAVAGDCWVADIFA